IAHRAGARELDEPLGLFPHRDPRGAREGAPATVPVDAVVLHAADEPVGLPSFQRRGLTAVQRELELAGQRTAERFARAAGLSVEPLRLDVVLRHAETDLAEDRQVEAVSLLRPTRAPECPGGDGQILAHPLASFVLRTDFAARVRVAAQARAER